MDEELITSASSMDPFVAFDESGYTGQDLLNKPQPLFVLASVQLDESKADELLANVAGSAAEAHYAQLAKRGRGRDKILRLLRSSELLEHARASVVHKPFMLISKMVDLLVEPVLSERGINLYANDGHIILSNLLYYRAGLACGDSAWHAVQEAFSCYVRSGNDQDGEVLAELLRFLRDSCQDHRLGAVLSLFPTTKNQLADALCLPASDLPRDDLDPAPTVLIEHCMAWSQQLPRFIVLHDSSKVILNWQQMLHEYLLHPERPKWQYPAGTRTLVYPLNASDLIFVDSRSSPLVQIADIIAGSVRTWALSDLGLRANDPFAERLNETNLPSVVQHAIVPESTRIADRLRLAKGSVGS